MGVEPVRHHSRQWLYPVNGFPYERVLKNDLSAMHLTDEVKRWLRARKMEVCYDVWYEHDHTSSSVRFLFRDYAAACLFKTVWG